MIVKSDKSSFESYLTDAANIKGDCEKVFFPENHNELVAVINDARDCNKTITVSASKTGLNGGSVPYEGILVSTEKLNRILKIDESKNCVIVEPGLTLKDLQDELDKYGLFYPPDPTEANCSLGGTVANNASGARTFKYGSTRNYVEAIKVILADGNVFEIERGRFISNGLTFSIKINKKDFHFVLPDYKMPDVKHSAGYFCEPDMDLIDLFIGSEGTLGVISEIKLRVINKPKAILSMIIFFDDEENLFSFIHNFLVAIIF
ncbi:MAG: FAD-binding oxidoreductase [Melioribacteraceae bacterium]|nr:FAD-binding oxidoreductase [Melioribacteraceae bacterium]